MGLGVWITTAMSGSRFGRFRVEKSWAFVRTNCIVMGTLEGGSLRPPVPMRMVPLAGSPRTPRELRVERVASFDNRFLEELGDGNRGRLALAGGPPRSGAAILGWQPKSMKWIDRGDVLTPV